MNGGERRLAAIMFTDIVGYTSLTEQSEFHSLKLLEEHRAVLRHFIDRFHGKEIKTIGDGTLVEFPSSLEAVECGYEIQTHLIELNKNRDAKDKIVIRIGIHAGDVIHTKSDIYGESVNLASKIESIAEPGGISVSEDIYKQVRNKVSFAFENIGERELKNVEHPLEIFKVVFLGSNSQQELLRDRSYQMGKTDSIRFLRRELPFTDRIFEIQALRDVIDKTVVTKQGSLVFISGEPGIGKTRLANESKKYAVTKNMNWLWTVCARSEDAAPYAPWIQLIREFASKAPTQLFYKMSGSYINQIVRLIPELAESSGVTPFHPYTIRDPSQEADVEALERGQFFQALTQFFVKLSKESSGLVLHFDDLQWADQATLQLLKFFISSAVSNEPIIILTSYRELEAKSGENPAVAKFLREKDYERRGLSIELKRFEESDVGKLLTSLSGQRDVSSEFTGLIYSKTGGNSFFIGEVIKSLFEKQDIFANERGQWDRKPIAEIEVPASIRTLIQERVARLDTITRETLQAASIIGDTFNYAILRYVAQENVGNDRLETALERAVTAGFIFEKKESQPSKLGSLFAFADESVRDVLLDEVDYQSKVSMHLKTALAMEKIAIENSNFKNEVSASIAFHYLSSGDKLKALEYSVVAGDRSSSLFAHEEAAKHYSVAVDLANNEELKARLLRSLGDETWLLGDSQGALGYWTASAEMYESAGNKPTASDLYRRIAFSYHTPFLDKNNSILYINKAIDLLEQSGQLGWELGAAYLNASLIYAWDSQIPKAKQLFERGSQLAKDSHNMLIQSVASYTSFWIANITEKDLVLQDCEESIKYLVETSNIRQAAFAQSTRAGWYALVRGPSKETTQAFDEAVAYAEKVGQYTAILALKASRAINVDLVLGKFEQVKRFSESLRLVADKSPSLLIVRCFADQTLGLLQLYLGDLVESRKNLAEVIKITNGFGNSSLALQPYTAIGRTYLIEGDLAEAEKFVALGLEISEKRKHLLSNAMVHMELVSLEIELAIRSKRKSLKETRDIISEMKSLSEDIDEPWASAYYLKSAGLLALNQIEVEESIRLLSESAVIWTKIGWLYELGRIKYEIALAYQRLGDVTNAKNSNHEALEIFSSLGARLNIQNCVTFDNMIQVHVALPNFLNQNSRITFDFLVGAFAEDYSVKNLSPQSSGWRTLKDIAKATGVPASSLYFRAGSGRLNSTLHELLASKIVEAKTFKGERGRGGEVTRYRISYEKQQVRDYVDRFLASKSGMLC